MLPSLSIVLPCYNPLPGWEQKVLQSIASIKQFANLVQLVVVNDGSAIPLDQAFKTLKENAGIPVVQISYPINKGKGNATRTGLKEATGDIIIYTDIDFPFTPESFRLVHDALAGKECDIAAGIKELSYYDNVPAARKYISKILRKMISGLLNLSITDTQCGLKGMTSTGRQVWLEGTIDRYLFDLEAIYRAEKKGLRVKAIPVRLREGVEFSHMPFHMLWSEFRNFVAIALKK